METEDKKAREMPKKKKKKNLLQQALMAIIGVMIAYSSQYATDALLRILFLFFGIAIVVYAVAK